MADINNVVVETEKTDVEAEKSGTEELISNSESDWQKSEWIRRIRSGLQARAGQNAVGDVPIIKLPAFRRKPVTFYTPRQWQFGLHNRDSQASGSESEDLKISFAAACKLNPDEWDKFCADVVDNPADMMLKSYGLYSGVTEFSTKEVQYLLTLDALTLVLVLSSFVGVCGADQTQALHNLFIRSLVDGGFNVEGWVRLDGFYKIWDDLYLCENQIPIALMKKVISKCYGLLPEERKFNYFPDLQEPENSDSNLTKQLLDGILKFAVGIMCPRLFPEPCTDKKKKFLNFVDVNYEVGELEDCAHVFACIYKVMTTCEESSTTEKTLPATDMEVFSPDVNELETDVEAASDKKSSRTGTEFVAPDVNQLEMDAEATTEFFAPDMNQLETDVEMPATVGKPTIFTTTFGRAKQFLFRAVATGSNQPTSIFATLFGFRRETVREKYIGREILQSATSVRRAGLRIEGTPGMLQQVAFQNGCLFLPINKFCSRPWLMISVISAIILLVATLIQTYVLVIGSDKMQPHFPRGG